MRANDFRMYITFDFLCPTHNATDLKFYEMGRDVSHGLAVKNLIISVLMKEVRR